MEMVMGFVSVTKMFAVPSGVVQRNEYIGKVSVFVIVIVVVIVVILIVIIVIIEEVHVYEIVIVILLLFIVDGKIIIRRFIVDDGVVKATKCSMQFRRSFVSFGIKRRI
jgi:uncharacterized membrane protein YhaH (DUF805 family)